MAKLNLMEALIRLFTTVAPDFQVLWLASKDLLTLNNPYLNTIIFTGVGYPPNSLLFYLPLTVFNYLVAQNIFTVLSILALLFCIYISFKILKIRNNLLMFFVVILSLLSFPTKFTLGMGQNNFIALALLLFSYLLCKERKLQYAGIFLGLVISLKTIFVYFLLFYILKKQWKVITYAFLILLLSTLFVYLIRGNLDLYKFYLTDILPPLFRFENREIYMNQGLSGFISRLFEDINIRKLLTSVISIILVLYNCLVIFKNKNVDLVFSLTIITLLLIDSLAWQHHFVWSLFPFIVLVKYSKNILIRLLIFMACILISLNLPSSNLLRDNVFMGTLILYIINLKLLNKAI